MTRLPTRTPLRRSIDIEQLLTWTFRNQRAHKIVPQGAGLQRAEALADGRNLQAKSGCGCASVERIAELGVRVDVSMSDPGQLHPDAETVYNAVTDLPRPIANLVARHAIDDTRPNWGEGMRPAMIPVWRKGPIYDAQGKPAKRSFQMIYDRNRNAIACKVIPVHEPDSIARLRQDYTRWYDALVALANTLNDRPLDHHVVTGPIVPAEPWRMR